MFKNNQGVTLVELLIGIAIGSLVTLAATTVILMGLRLNRQSMDVSSRQNTARVLLNSLEDLAADGSISGFRMDYEDWEIYGDQAEELNGETAYNKIYYYVAKDNAIYTGDSQNRTAIMKNVLSSYVEYEDGLLTISVETKEGIFNSTVYCRIAISPSGISGSAPTDDEEIDKNKAEQEAENDTTSLGDDAIAKTARLAFVKVLLSQYSTKEKNFGCILDEDGKNTKHFYSEWYITNGFTNTENWGKNGWDALTPWCACYVSWAIAEVEGYTNYGSGNFRPVFAGVDSFLSYFYSKDNPETEIKRDYWITADFWKTEETKAQEGHDRKVYPGDIIFLDWVFNEERNPQHVGVVLFVDEENRIVYTIEGNVAASYTDSYGTVGLRKYSLDDPRILGYGVLDWKTDEELASQTS